MICSPALEPYFKKIEAGIARESALALAARKKGFDPEEKVDIPLAKGISERVEGLISAVVPQILGSGVAKRIDKLEKEYGALDWRVALKIAEEVARQKFCKFDTKLKAMETGIRVGLSYITLGVISAPLEGFIELQVKKTADGKEYFSVLYAGPIRAAGGTAEAVSLIIADYVRKQLGYARYDPTEKEIKRTITEVTDYHERITNLQYRPSEIEMEFLIKNLPVEINGDPTEEKEVSNYKDLPRIHTNRIRGGLCLVMAEGLAQKAPKLYKKIRVWGEEMGLEWGFLKEFLDIQKKVKAKKSLKKEALDKISPNYTFIKDLVAGRPILSHPMAYGGLRLRYGRTRLTGLAAAAMSPATLEVLDEFIATGTQLKTERPGKAAAIVPSDVIDGPIVKTKKGDVLKLSTQAQAKKLSGEIENILFLGDILYNYGDFSENGHKLVPSGYCQEWWIRELESRCIGLFGTVDYDKISTLLGVNPESVFLLFKEPITTKISFRLAKRISNLFRVALHPDFLFFWTALSVQELKKLISFFEKAKPISEEGKLLKLVLPNEPELKQLLEKAGIPHLLINNEFIVIQKREAQPLDYLLIQSRDRVLSSLDPGLSVLDILSLSGITIKDKAGTFIGARMGRPEKAKMRKLAGSPHMLFPVGEEGGRMRCISSAVKEKKITADFPVYFCKKCNKETIFSVCEACWEKTEKREYCRTCKKVVQSCKTHGSRPYYKKEIDIKRIFSACLSRLNTRIYPDLIKGVKGTSNKDHVPEHLIKGILRAKHGIYVNKDGTTRYDMIELPVTHFTPKEIGTNIDKLRQLGYSKDIKGKPLESPDQMLELLPQDMILPDCPEAPDEFCSDVLFNVANFIDDLLVNLYGLEPYYNLRKPKDIVGHLVIGLAPHTSAGTVGRVIGFSKTQGMFTHPLFHAAMRRNCDGDEACVMLLLDGLLNFSRSFLPDKRGSRTMDAPLVLTSLLIPGEVDDEVHGMDLVPGYPLEFYRAAEEYKYPWDVEIYQIKHYLNNYRQYEKMSYTHGSSDINMGVVCSAYKTLPSMEEKLHGQMDLAEKISAVDTSDVARLVIEKHFIRDIKGNLRKYSTQQFRCVGCNTKYRRPPMKGRCLVCGGKIIFTISKGSIIKYMAPSLSIAKKYGVSPYLMQTLELTQERIDSVLGKEKEIQKGLGSWFG